MAADRTSVVSASALISTKAATTDAHVSCRLLASDLHAGLLASVPASTSRGRSHSALSTNMSTPGNRRQIAKAKITRHRRPRSPPLAHSVSLVGGSPSTPLLTLTPAHADASFAGLPHAAPTNAAPTNAVTATAAAQLHLPVSIAHHSSPVSHSMHTAQHAATLVARGHRSTRAPPQHSQSVSALAAHQLPLSRAELEIDLLLDDVLIPGPLRTPPPMRRPAPTRGAHTPTRGAHTPVRTPRAASTSSSPSLRPSSPSVCTSGSKALTVARMEQELAEREYLESHATELNGTEGERRRARRTARELGRDAYVKALECTVITSESEKATLKAILESQQLNRLSIARALELARAQS